MPHAFTYKAFIYTHDVDAWAKPAFVAHLIDFNGTECEEVSMTKLGILHAFNTKEQRRTSLLWGISWISHHSQKASTSKTYQDSSFDSFHLGSPAPVPLG